MSPQPEAREGESMSESRRNVPAATRFFAISRATGRDYRRAKRKGTWHFKRFGKRVFMSYYAPPRFGEHRA